MKENNKKLVSMIAYRKLEKGSDSEESALFYKKKADKIELELKSLPPIGILAGLNCPTCKDLGIELPLYFKSGDINEDFYTCPIGHVHKVEKSNGN